MGHIDSMGGRVVAAAVVGGTTSVISGGKFANGAITGAFSYAFNTLAHEAARQDAQRRFEAAEKFRESVMDTLTTPKFLTTDEAAVWFSDMMQDASTKYRLEFMANIAPAEGGGYLIKDVTTGNIFDPKTNVGYSGKLDECFDCAAWTHTHPSESSFSFQDQMLPGRDLQTAYVSMPSGAIDRYSAALGITTLRSGR